MTNFSPSSARKRLLVVGLGAVFCGLVLTGCGCSSPEETDPVAAAEAAQTAFADKDYPKAVAHCRRSLELSSDQIDVAVLMARAALEAKDLDSAKEAVEKAKALGPNDVSVIQLSGDLALAGGDYAEAIKIFTKLVTDPEYRNRPDIQAIGYTCRGIANLAHYRAGNAPDDCRDRAHIDLLQAVCLDRDGAKAAYYHLGLLYADVFKYRSAAIDQFNNYCHRMKGSDDEHVEKAQSRIAGLKNDRQAELKRIPGSDSIRSSECAKAIQNAKKLEATNPKLALAQYEAALKYNPTKFEAAKGAAEMAKRVDRTRAGLVRACNYYKKAALLESDPSVLKNVGDLSLRLGQNITAVEYYCRALASSPEDKAAVDGLVRALSATKRGRASGAYKMYGELVQSQKLARGKKRAAATR